MRSRAPRVVIPGAVPAIGIAVALVAATLGALPQPASSDSTLVVQTAGTISVSGRGYGHGRGLGQWGAYGYATKPDLRWSYDRILDRYFGGTTMGPVPADRTNVGVLLKATSSRAEVIVTSDLGRVITSVGTPGAQYPGLKVRVNPAGGLDVVRADAGCGSPDGAVVATGVTATVMLDVFGNQVNATDPATVLAVCQADGSSVYYRGGMRVDRGASTVTVNNDLTLEQYLRGVVPREMPASWGSATNGMEALKAQAVSARSYTVARNGVICDDQACQVYGGMAARPAGSATVALREDSRTDAAIAATAGQVRVFGDGRVAATEYSSSTGGWTAGGTFPAVADDGDDVDGNPNDSWSTTLAVSAVEARYPAIGALRSISITKRNGLGLLGGRVLTMVLQGASGAQTLTGDDFRLAFGLKSNWFALASTALEFPASGVANAGLTGAYWVTGPDGTVSAFNGAPAQGGLTGIALNAPIIGMAAAGATGYWLLGRDGGIFSFNAPFYGSTGGLRLNSPVVAMVGRPDASGYWFAAGDGGVFAFGAARFWGSMGGQRLNKPVVGIASTPTGAGYWLVASDGGIFSFGDALFYGSTGGIRLVQPIVAMAARPQGDGYWLVAADGGVFSFGAAPFLGSAAGLTNGVPVVGVSATPTGLGYRLVTAKGAAFAFGDAA